MHTPAMVWELGEYFIRNPWCLNDIGSDYIFRGFYQIPYAYRTIKKDDNQTIYVNLKDLSDFVLYYDVDNDVKKA